MTIKAFCIDFNWGDNGPAEPGRYANADPQTHVDWYEELGANVIQTFCVSYNGYAWYRSDAAPVTPGLKCPDFLGKMAELGHRRGIKVMGYFTLGANPFWEARNPELVHAKDSDNVKIPFTDHYLDYFCNSVIDALKKNDIDGFMIDWVRPTQHRCWLECEKTMFKELLHEEFPSDTVPSPETILEFDRRAIERAWSRIRQATLSVRPVKIWTNHPLIEAELPVWDGNLLLREADWILNESPDLKFLSWLEKHVGKKTLVIQNLCGWKNHDASAWRKVDAGKFGFYGYARANPITTLVSDPMHLKNIEYLKEAFRNLP